MGRVVVTGGAGFLGSHLCESLLERGHEVVCLDNLSTGAIANIEHLFAKPGFTFEQHNVSNYIWVPGHVDGVMHFASPASPKDYLDLPIQTLKVGSLGTHNTLGLALAKGARYFLASTSEVYGDPQIHPQTEEYWGHVNPVGPRGVYDEAKRFAEAMTMAYHRSHGLDVRIIRIFNSILADEQVLYDDGVELRRETIGQLAQRLRGTIDLDDYTVPAFEADGTMVAAEASALVGHPTEATCFEVRTQYGRSIRVTGDHSLFIRGEDGRPVARTTTELAVGDRIAIARRISVVERDRTSVDVAEAWTAGGGDPWRLWLEMPELGELAWDRRQEIFDLTVEHRRPTNDHWRNSIWTPIISMRRRDRLPMAVADEFGIEPNVDARVRMRTAGASVSMPAQVPLTDEMLWLLGLYVAEGCYQRHGDQDCFITISCEDDVLDRAQKVIERDLGLHVIRTEASSARSASLVVHSKLLLAVLDHLGFDHGRKRIPGWILGLPLERLGWFLEGYREGDGVHSGKKFDEGVGHEFSTVHEELKDDLIVALARFGIVPSVGRYHSTIKNKTGDRQYPFWRLTVCKVAPWSPLDWHRGVEQTLQSPVTEDLVWARVTELVEIESTPLVYDFCVPGRENFWAGSGVMAHNTYGPRMRPDDGRVVSNFISQALAGKALTIYGDGQQSRSFCYVDDEVRGILALFASDYVGPMNIGNTNEFTMKELAEVVLEVTGSSSEIVYEPLPVDDPTQRQPDITLAKREIGWEAEVQLREGIERTAEYFRSLLPD